MGPLIPVCVQSVIHQSLEERHKILSAMVADPPPGGTKLGKGSVVGRVFPLVQGRRFLNDMTVTRTSTKAEDIQEAFEDALKGEVLLTLPSLGRPLGDSEQHVEGTWEP